MRNDNPFDSSTDFEQFEELQHLDDVWREAEVKPTAPAVPDGEYNVEVIAVELTRTQGGDPLLKWTLRVLDGDYQGRMLRRSNVIKTDANVRFLKKDLLTAGLDLERLSDLPREHKKLKGRKLFVKKQTRGEYSIVYINGLLVDDEDL